MTREELRRLAELANEWLAEPEHDDLSPESACPRCECARELVVELEAITGCRVQITGTGIAPTIIGDPK